MKAFLMCRDTDFDVEQELPGNATDLMQDLELDTLLDAMAGGDALLRQIANTAILSSLTNPEQIVYRQQVLRDCLRHPALVRELYCLAGEAISGEKEVYGILFSKRPDPLLHRSIKVLEMFVGMLKRLRQVADEHAQEVSSEGFVRFFEMLRTELDDDYFALVEHHLKELHFRDGVLIRARLGGGNEGIDYLLRTPREENRSFLRRASVKKPSYSLTISDRDQSGAQALSELRDRGLNLVANALTQSADHVLSFFAALRTEIGFYVGCLNLQERLAGKGGPICLPEPHDPEPFRLTARELYEPCLSLRIDERAIGNDVSADGKSLVMITGANQGGKSTYLRGLGLAQLMMQCGMFVAAASFSASACRGLFTHYKREEDATMASGKLDEELARMSEIADHIQSGSLLVCNESFAATNEREGSAIARDVIRALLDEGVRVCFVTHLFDLAHGLYDEDLERVLFLRADRQDEGIRTFHVTAGEPLPTSYGLDLYRRIFAAGGGGADSVPRVSPASALPGERATAAGDDLNGK